MYDVTEEVLWADKLEVSLLPRTINLEFTNRCNLRCDFCINHQPTFREKGDLPEHILDNLIIELPPSTEISICGVGEPTLHPKFSRYLEKLSSHFTNLSLVTNGQNLTPAIIDSVIASNINKVIVSLDYFSEETYKMRKGGDLEHVCQGIKELFAARKNIKNKLSIQINMLAQKNQESEIERAISFFNQFLGPKDCIYTRSIKTLAGQVKVSTMTEDSWLGLEKFKEDLSKRIDTSKFVVENWCRLLKLKGPIEKRKACRHPYKYCMILWDGTVVGCCIDFNGHLKMGNLNNESLYEIWTGERYNRFRRAMEKLDFRKYKLCESCEEWYKCI